MASRSLRLGLLFRLGTALVVLLILDAIACYFTASHFANLVYDRWLIDSARSLSQAVRAEDGHIQFELPQVGLQVFRFDEVDQTYFAIKSEHGDFIAGDANLPEPERLPNGAIHLSTAMVASGSSRQPVRVVSTSMIPAGADEQIYIQVAETLAKRAKLAEEIVFAMVAPQIALLAIALLMAWFGVSRGLKPLTDLASQIESRGHDNLSPILEIGLPREAGVLVGRINELLGRLANAMRAQRRFVADAAHQLRTPLAAVMLEAERAERATDTETQRTALVALHTSVTRAARLSQQLLALARSEPDSVAVTEFKTIDLTELARGLGEEWISRALERDIDFGLLVPDQPVWVSGETGLLGEMLSNLVDNAFRYSRPRGHVTLIVQSGAQPILAVEDDGPGIPEEERSRILQRFYRIPGTSGEGCGLGMAIVDDIARLHHAEVIIASGSLEIGTRVSVRFRAADKGPAAPGKDSVRQTRNGIYFSAIRRRLGWNSPRFAATEKPSP